MLFNFGETFSLPPGILVAPLHKARVDDLNDGKNITAELRC